jgi:hypothetical protein
LNQEKLLSQLLSIAEQLGVEVKEEKGDFNGGLCRVDDEKIIYVNKKHDIVKKVAVLLDSLSEQDLDDVYILPAIREIIDNHRDSKSVQSG